ncbi:MAG: photosystem I reaction center subunit XI [Drouetiella hepatica Uher 2000/2452]|jgi:photosystem I subunit 11|uniref:Photosystem I reaction center subunit XI n=1 Tax=Drouetiella hepatica Uher 2000/2452 TaxID=904376 RepID=A0A951UP29_9CYAN|nr:photosystem I reaction center subunit XI [Drouetiella hepatica Uher 2000/2452]
MTKLVDKIERSNSSPTDLRNQEVIYPVRDSQYGDLETPINSSVFVRRFVGNLSAYRPGLSPLRRGLEVGLAHGYLLVGPFAKFNPLRYTESGTLVALLSTLGLVLISSVLIVLYAASNPPKPLSATAAPTPPDAFQSKKGWNDYAKGFLLGGAVGAIAAYFILANFDVYGNFLTLIGAK